MIPILQESNSINNKVEALCPVFGKCQGCSYQDIPYEDELRLKEQWLRDLLRGDLDIDDACFSAIVPSPKSYYYRNRLDLKLKRTREQGILIGFTPVDRRGILPVDACHIAQENISGFIPELKKQAIKKLPSKYRIANLVVRTGDDGRILWGGIGRKSCKLLPKDYLWTYIKGKKIFYSLDTFFQANSSILSELFDVIRSFDFWHSKPIFCDLYGGVGLFGIVLAEQAKRVILIEDNPSSCTLARYNMAANGVKNCKVVKGKIEDKLTDLLNKKSERMNVAMVDPPRAGLSRQSGQMLAGQQGLFHP